MLCPNYFSLVNGYNSFNSLLNFLRVPQSHETRWEYNYDEKIIWFLNLLWCQQKQSANLSMYLEYLV